MADFTSSFWHWFISITTVLSLLWCLWLVLVNRIEKPSTQVQSTGHVWDEDLRELNNPLPRWWFVLFILTIIFGAVYVVLYPGLGAYQGMLGWSQVGRYEAEVAEARATYDPLFDRFASIPVAELSKDAEAMRAGERLFANYCTTCHGSDARGAPGFPNLRDDTWLWGGAPEAIEMSITSGRQGVMPAWQGALGDDGVRNVAAYVEQLAGREVDAEFAAAGKEKYDMLCIACHQADGSGNPALGAPNLTDRDWLYGGSTYSIRQSIAGGRNGVMPPHGEFLGASRVHLLSAYVYSLSRGE